MAAISTVQFTLQVFLPPVQWLSYVLSFGTGLALLLLVIRWKRRHHPWANGALAGYLAVYVLPVIYIVLLSVTGSVM
jgi:hypothetical protein